MSTSREKRNAFWAIVIATAITLWGILLMIGLAYWAPLAWFMGAIFVFVFVAIFAYGMMDDLWY